MEQAIFAYQDWYENEPYPHGYSGTDADGDGIYEIPGGPDLATGKQHDLAVTIATLNLDLKTKYANALYTYTVAEWDAWLTFTTDTINADKEYEIATTNAEKDFTIKINNAESALEGSLASLAETYNKAIVAAGSEYTVEFASAMSSLITSRAQTGSNHAIAMNNASLARQQTEASNWWGFTDSALQAFFQRERENTNLTTDEVALSFEKEGWSSAIISASLGLENEISGAISGYNNAFTTTVTGVTTGIANAGSTFTQSKSNATKDYESGLISSDSILWNSVFGADQTFANVMAGANATFNNALSGLNAAFQIGAANINALNGKIAAAAARDATIKTANDHLDSATNDSSYSDYYLDGNNYDDAFNFVGEAYYYAAGLYLDFGPPPGAIIVKVQEWIDSLQGTTTSGSGSSSGAGFTSGSTSASSSGSGSSSSSGSTSSSGNNSSSGTGSSSTSGSSSGSSSSSGSGSSSTSGSSSGSGSSASTEEILAMFSVEDDISEPLPGSALPGGGYNPLNWLGIIAYFPTEVGMKSYYNVYGDDITIRGKEAEFEVKLQSTDGRRNDELREIYRRKNQKPVSDNFNDLIQNVEISVAGSYGARPGGGPNPGSSSKSASNKVGNTVAKKIDDAAENIIKKPIKQKLTSPDIAKFKQIRDLSELTSSPIGKHRNIAIANGKINGKVIDDIVSVSGEGTQGVTMPATRKFEVFNIPAHHDRSWDSEVFIFENLANQLKVTDSGTIRLISENVICPSCNGVITQFKDRFPHIRLIIVDPIQ